VEVLEVLHGLSEEREWAADRYVQVGDTQVDRQAGNRITVVLNAPGAVIPHNVPHPC
jgi:hypothetical protein